MDKAQATPGTKVIVTRIRWARWQPVNFEGYVGTIEDLISGEPLAALVNLPGAGRKIIALSNLSLRVG